MLNYKKCPFAMAQGLKLHHHQITFKKIIMKTLMIFVAAILTGLLSYEISTPESLSGYALFVGLWTLFHAFALQVVTIVDALLSSK